jgi:hypothetical protein
MDFTDKCKYSCPRTGQIHEFALLNLPRWDLPKLQPILLPRQSKQHHIQQGAGSFAVFVAQIALAAESYLAGQALAIVIINQGFEDQLIELKLFESKLNHA